MPIITTQGVVLKRRNFHEADRILTIFTKKLGKISARARGVRKTKSKLAGHLEPYMLVDMRLAEGVTWYTLTEAQIIEAFPKLRLNLKQTSAAYYVGELVTLLFQDNDPHPRIFNLLVEMLGMLEQGKNGLLLPSFLWHVMAEIGYSPELFYCVKCAKKLTQNDLYFSHSLGGFLDGLHRSEDPTAQPVLPETVKLLRVARNNVNLIPRIAIDEKIAQEFRMIVTDFSRRVLEREPKSERFIKDLNIYSE